MPGPTGYYSIFASIKHLVDTLMIYRIASIKEQQYLVAYLIATVVLLDYIIFFSIIFSASRKDGA